MPVLVAARSIWVAAWRRQGLDPGGDQDAGSQLPVAIAARSGPRRSSSSIRRG
jgi:hypothetical protein